MAQLLISQFMFCNDKTRFWDKVLTKAGLSFTVHEALQFHNFCILSHYRVTLKKKKRKKERLSWSTNRLNELPEICIFSALLKQEEDRTFLRQKEFSNTLNRRKTSVAVLAHAPVHERRGTCTTVKFKPAQANGAAGRGTIWPPPCHTLISSLRSPLLPAWIP